MSTQSNVFSALQPEKHSKKKSSEATPNSMFASFVNNPSSTTAWGDDSDEEVHIIPTSHSNANPPAGNQEQEEDDEESESESESEEEEEEESVKPAAATDGKKAVVGPIRTLSKKEKKELEMQELDAALAALGIKTQDGAAADNQPMKKEQDVDQKQVEAGSVDKKSKKKKKGKKLAKPVESETPDVGVGAAGVVDIKAVMKTKSKKKKAVEPEAVRIAREEKTKGKTKGKKDKSSFNEFSI